METDKNTLSNVVTRRGGFYPPTLDLLPMSPPESQNRLAGVSLDYVRKENHKWFVLRATYNRVIKAYEIFANDHVQAYLPMRYKQKQIKGKKKRIMVPLLPNIIFVYATEAEIENYISWHPVLSLFLRYFRNRLEPKGVDGKNPPLVVRFGDMMNFIHLTSVYNEHVRVVDPQQCHYKSGDIVRIVDGDFKGVNGKVARVAGQQRVVVEIEGLCLVATAYIPTAFIEIVEQK